MVELIDNEKKIIQMYVDGFMGNDIYKECNCSRNQVYPILKKHNIKTRKQLRYENLLSDSSIKNICESYKSGGNYGDIADKYHVEETRIKQILIGNGIKVKPRGKESIYTCNDNFFREETEGAAYWSGFIAADGYIRSNQYSKRLCIEISTKDIDHLYKFKDCLNATNPIFTRTRIGCNDRNKSFNSKDSKTCSISINSKRLCEDLCSIYNISERKTLTLNPPNLSNEQMIKWYIRGMTDGDGSISGNRIIWYGTKAICEWIREKIILFAGTNTESLVYTQGDKLFKFMLGGLKAKNSIDWLYVNSDEKCRLERKYDGAMNIVNGV